MKDRLLIVLLSASLGFNAYFIWDKSQEKEVSTDDVEIKGSATIERPSVEVSQRKTVNSNAQKNTVSALEKKIDLLEKELVTQKNTSLKKPRNTSEVGFVVANDRNKELGLSAKQAMRNYEEESADQNWSYETKRKIEQVIMDNNLLSKVNVKDISCKSTICKLSVEPFQDGYGSKMSSSIDLLSKINNSKDKEISNLSAAFSTSGEQQFVDIYLYKEPKEKAN